MRMCIVYLASPRTHHIYDDPKQASRLDLLEGSLRITRRLFPTTDILIFHEDFVEEDFARLSLATRFIQVDFSGQEDRYNSSLRRPYGYMMMCRFFSGQLQRHPALSDYTHYMRLDDDSYFQPPFLQEKDIPVCDYLYRSVFYDVRDQQSLWEFTRSFLQTEGYGMHLSQLEQYLERQKVVIRGNYTGIAPYNNFHVSSLRLWRSPLVTRYIDAIEREDGILKRGWMDANIHAMIVSAMTPLLGFNVQTQTSFGYRHNRHVSTMGALGVTYIDSLPFTAEATS